MKKKLVLPEFENEDDELEFWCNIDLSEYFESSDFKPFDLDRFLAEHRDLETTRVTLWLPVDLVKRYRDKADKLDVSYQDLMEQQLVKGA